MECVSFGVGHKTEIYRGYTQFYRDQIIFANTPLSDYTMIDERNLFDCKYLNLAKSSIK